MSRPPTCLCGNCRKCRHRIRQQRWWDSKTAEQRREIVQRRDPEKVKVSQARREQKPERRRKRQARTILHDAVRDGKIQKQPCAICGSPQVEAHHLDYEQPLSVEWLCKEHHKGKHPSKRTPLSTRPALVPEETPDTPCEIWDGGKSGPGGYGRLWIHGRIVYAHRNAWEIKHGPIPPRRHIHHICHNRDCINADHLRLITPEEHGRYSAMQRWSNA